MSEILRKLTTLLGPNAVLVDDDVSSRSVSFWDDSRIEAKAIVRPRTTKEVSEVMKLCYEAGQVVVPQGGRTNLVKGCLTTSDDIILSLERMTNIESVDPINRTTVVEGGVILESLHNEVAEHDMMFPLDFGARGSCTIGGVIATNAGGTMVLKYGMTSSLVLGLEAVLPDGTIVTSMQDYIKNNTGYDLKSLFCGSEGTLGIITRAVLRLWENLAVDVLGYWRPTALAK